MKTFKIEVILKDNSKEIITICAYSAISAIARVRKIYYPGCKSTVL